MKRPTLSKTADVAEGIHELQEETEAQKIADAKYEEECRKTADEYHEWLDRFISSDFDDDFHDNDPVEGRGSWDDENLNEFDYDGF